MRSSSDVEYRYENISYMYLPDLYVKYLAVLGLYTPPYYSCSTAKTSVPELVRRKFAQFVKFYFLGENVQWNVNRPSQSSTALVVIQNGVEAGTISVEEILVTKRIEVSNATGWIT